MVRIPTPGAVEVVEYSAALCEARAAEKLVLVETRGLSNAEAEAILDQKGYPRPPGWHAILFYPDSLRPRNSTVVFAAGLSLWWLLHVTHHMAHHLGH